MSDSSSSDLTDLTFCKTKQKFTNKQLKQTPFPTPLRKPSITLSLPSAFATTSLRQWILSICIVTFDIQAGQTIQTIIPPSDFDSKTLSSIAFAAFPDHNDGITCDMCFIYKIAACDWARRMTGSDVIFAYSCFRQYSDRSLSRGYFQKSVVVLTHLPFHAFWLKVVKMVGAAYFKNGKEGLEGVCDGIGKWERKKGVMKLECTGEELCLVVGENRVEEDALVGDVESPKLFIAEALPVGLFKLLDLLDSLWLLWELILLGESVVVFSKTPDICSTMILALVDLIRPIEYAGECLPYVTIQDADRISKGKWQKHKIVGVTNDHFSKMLQTWPHFVKCSDSTHLTTTYKSFLEKDKEMIRLLIESKVLGYLNNRTQKFLAPLDAYFETLVTEYKSINDCVRRPQLLPFGMDRCVRFVEHFKPTLKFAKKEWLEMYKQFLQSVNFSAWMLNKSDAAMERMQEEYIKVLAEVDILHEKFGESRVLFLMERIREELHLASERWKEKLEKQLGLLLEM